MVGFVADSASGFGVVDEFPWCLLPVWVGIIQSFVILLWA